MRCQPVANPWPIRRVLPHLRLSWPDAHAVYLITLCGVPRGRNQLARASVAEPVVQVLQFHEARATWHLHACVLMPDHLHFIATLPASTDLARVIADSKRYLAVRHAVRWQRGFHDRRLRRQEHYVAKLDYLRQNPVRAGLVQRWQDWPFFWEW